MTPEISIVIPCLNEEQTIGLCIRKAQQSFAELGVEGEVVVSDNGSADRSVQIARELGARVTHAERKGYGAALLAEGCERGRDDVRCIEAGLGVLARR